MEIIILLVGTSDWHQIPYWWVGRALDKHNFYWRAGKKEAREACGGEVLGLAYHIAKVRCALVFDGDADKLKSRIGLMIV